DGGGEFGAGDVLPAGAGPVQPGLGQVAGVIDRLLLAGAVVADAADAVAARLVGVVAFGVVAALAAFGVVDGDQRAHRRAPMGWAALAAAACRWANRGSRYTRAPNPNRPVVLVVVHPACSANASPWACTRSDSRCRWRVAQLMSACLRFWLGG